MKACIKLMLSVALMMVITDSNAQNGGQYPENNSTKIEHIGYTGNQAVVRVTNKQTCEAEMRIIYGTTARTKFIAATSADTFHVTPPANGRVAAKTETNCGFADFGLVELTLNTILPIKFGYLKAKRLDASTMEVEFRAYDVDGQSKFNIQVSTDGRVFKTVAVILPDPIQADKVYKVKVPLK